MDIKTMVNGLAAYANGSQEVEGFPVTLLWEIKGFVYWFDEPERWHIIPERWHIIEVTTGRELTGNCLTPDQAIRVANMKIKSKGRLRHIERAAWLIEAFGEIKQSKEDGETE